MAVSHKGAISFGLVHIPVSLYTATQDHDIHFNQLCKGDMSRVRYKKVCAGCGKEVGPKDIIKGFEYGPVSYTHLCIWMQIWSQYFLISATISQI